jgi:hypothetical protein
MEISRRGISQLASGMVEAVQRRDRNHAPIGIEMAGNPTKELSLIFRHNTDIDIIDGAFVGSGIQRRYGSRAATTNRYRT